MGKRRDNRVVVSMGVRVSGIDYDGNPFTQTAQTIDVSRTGARLSGIRCLRGPGEMVTIECGGLSARFLVVWVGQPGSSEDGHFGVKALQPEKRIFRVDPGAPRPDVYVPPLQQPSEPFVPTPPTPSSPWDRSERRGAKRIRCSGTGHITQPGVAFPIWAKVADVSMGGCYVELVFAIPRGSIVDVSLTINNKTFAAKGKVVTSHPGVGIGIRFSHISPEDQKILADLLEELTAIKRRPVPTDSSSG